MLVKALYFGYFFRLSVFEYYEFIRSRYSFNIHPKGRSPGTLTDLDSLDDLMDDLYYYMQYIKFGFGRCIRDVSRFIQNGHLARKEALDLCLKYDGEFPKKTLKRY